MNKIKVTASELAEQIGVDYPTAANLAKLMVARGQGVESAKRPSATGKGKPSTVYELNTVFTLNLVEEKKAAA